jgi:hypothetical protein
MSQKFLVRDILIDALCWIGYMLAYVAIILFVIEMGVQTRMIWTTDKLPASSVELYKTFGAQDQSETKVFSIIWFMFGTYILRLLIATSLLVLISEIRTKIFHGIFMFMLIGAASIRGLLAVVYIVIRLDCTNFWYCSTDKHLFDTVMMMCIGDTILYITLLVWRAIAVTHVESVKSREEHVRRLIRVQ